MYISLALYIYIYIYVYISVYIYIYLYISLSLTRGSAQNLPVVEQHHCCVASWTCRRLRGDICISVHMYISIHVSLSLSIYIYIYICIDTYNIHMYTLCILCNSKR